MKADLAAITSASTEAAARLFGVSTPAVDRWRSEIDKATGIWRTVKTKGRGASGVVRWDLPKLMAWRIRHLTATAGKAAKELDPLEAEHLRRLRAENDKRDGLLVSRAEMERQWTKAGSELRQRLEVLGRRHGPTVANDLARVMSDLARSMHGLLGSS